MMDELINIANYCNSVLIKYGQVIRMCNAIYIKDDDVIQINIRYRNRGDDMFQTYQYQIENFDFLITDTEVMVNRSAINNINTEIEKIVYVTALN
jgi:hypothetical protein